MMRSHAIFNRRTFLAATGLTALDALAGPGRHAAAVTFGLGPWRRFEITTTVDIAVPQGRTQAWIPLPSFAASDWFQPGGSRWQTNANVMSFGRDPVYGAEILRLVWNAGASSARAEILSLCATRDRATDFSTPRAVTPLSAQERSLYLSATELIPTDGIVRDTAMKIVAGAGNDLARARAIYDWVVENTFRNGATRGCGLGDVKSMLETGFLGGKCADINALYVGLARAAGLPARDIYGLRVAPANSGYKSLGTSSATVTRAQHCRAEVWIDPFGWVPVDPADVRKVALEEPPGNLPLGDPKVAAARSALFGSWEMNWIAYNSAHDLALPGSAGPRVPFLMYPQAETGDTRLDSLDPDSFVYRITARELT